MAVDGLQGSRVSSIKAILATGSLLPGPDLHHWLGNGPYAFDTYPDAAVAYENSLAFARRKYPDEEVGCVCVTVSTRHALDLQHHEIHQALTEVARIVTTRATALGLMIEPNRGWVRTQSHFEIDMYCELFKALYGFPLDAVRARFSGQFIAPIEERVNHEVCIKRPGAIINIKEVRSLADLHLTQTANSWDVSNLQLKANRETVPLARSLSDSSFIDLAIRIAEGPNPAFHNKNRFGNTRRVPLIVRENGDLASEVQRFIQSPPINNPSATVFQTELLNELSRPEWMRRIDQLLAQSSGIVVVADAPDPASNAALSSLLIHARTRDLAMLVLATKVDSLPPDIFSARNATIVKLKPNRQRQQQVKNALAGFFANDWMSDTQQVRLELMNVARGHDEFSTNESKIQNISDFKKIAEEVRRNYLFNQELPGLFKPERDDVLHNLPMDTEDAAEELRRVLNIETFAVSKGQMLRAMAAREVQVLMSVSGHTIPAGFYGPSAIVALNKNDSRLRQKFSVAHEMAHAVVDVAKWRLPTNTADPNEAWRVEEEYCYNLASTFLMPGSQVAYFAQQVTTLSDWLAFPSKFDVSFSAAAKRLWMVRRVLLVSSKTPIRASPRPGEAEQLVNLGQGLRVGDERRGLLANGAPFFVRHSKEAVYAVADFSKLEDANTDGV